MLWMEIRRSAVGLNLAPRHASQMPPLYEGQRAEPSDRPSIQDGVFDGGRALGMPELPDSVSLSLSLFVFSIPADVLMFWA